MMRVLTTAQGRILEDAWIKQCHESWGFVLMETAGLAASRSAIDLFGLEDTESGPAKITVLCGGGNNGGDGLVVARHLHRVGFEVVVFIVDSKNPSPENLLNRQILENVGLEAHILKENDREMVEAAIEESSLVVDALLGTGIDRPVEGLYADLINLVNENDCPIFSIDLPSGINSDTGQVMSVAIEADATITFTSIKPGLLCHPGANFAGEIELVDIGLPLPEILSAESYEFLPELANPCFWLVTASDVTENLPFRPQDSHKGSFGQVLLVSGSRGMSGSSILAAHSTLRSGAGMAIVATPKSLLPSLPPEEIIYRGLSETDDGTISKMALKELETELEKAQVCIIGPGLSGNEETVSLVHELIKKIRIPTVIDADGLNALAQNPKVLADTEGGFIFTPHPKELSRLLDKSTKEIQADRIGSAQEAAKRFGAVIVLKGSNTIVATPDGDVYIITTGNSGMATAGSGDVLTGVIAGLLAQGMSLEGAALAGAYIHGAAGDLAADDLGEDGMIAGDISASVPEVMKWLREGAYPGSLLEQSLFGFEDVEEE
ncbi:MAG: NAD(P)H-hydrate dehydratase [Candidatus Obscuribacterales bacterium]|nr:NAD(P)H-hydrate dehydratase [Candidatus Obscuribacterales bacterium]